MIARIPGIGHTLRITMYSRSSTVDPMFAVMRRAVSYRLHPANMCHKSRVRSSYRSHPANMSYIVQTTYIGGRYAPTGLEREVICSDLLYPVCGRFGGTAVIHLVTGVHRSTDIVQSVLTGWVVVNTLRVGCLIGSCVTQHARTRTMAGASCCNTMAYCGGVDVKRDLLANCETNGSKLCRFFSLGMCVDKGRAGQHVRI